MGHTTVSNIKSSSVTLSTRPMLTISDLSRTVNAKTDQYKTNLETKNFKSVLKLIINQ